MDRIQQNDPVRRFRPHKIKSSRPAVFRYGIPVIGTVRLPNWWRCTDSQHSVHTLHDVHSVYSTYVECIYGRFKYYMYLHFTSCIFNLECLCFYCAASVCPYAGLKIAFFPPTLTSNLALSHLALSPNSFLRSSQLRQNKNNIHLLQLLYTNILVLLPFLRAQPAIYLPLSSPCSHAHSIVIIQSP